MRAVVAQRSCLPARPLQRQCVTAGAACTRRLGRQKTVNGGRHGWVAKSAEGSADQVDSNGQAVAVEQSPLDDLRQAIAAEELDREALARFTDEVERNVEQLLECVSAAERKTASVETSLLTAKDQFLRLNADFDNFRKRTAKEKEQLSATVKSDIVSQLLPLVDNFELARTQVKPETEGEQRINNSYQSLYKQMVEVMRSLGVEAISTVGDPFDPAFHDAIMREPSDDVPDGTVLMEFRKGFKLGEKLIRPAMVKVSFSDVVPAVAPAPAAEDSQEEGAPEGSSEKA